MISKIKKPVSILLSLIMIVSLFTIVPFTASAAFGYSDLARGTLIQPGDSFYFDQIDSFKFADYNDPTIIHEVKGSDFSYNWTTLSVTDGYYSFGSTKLLPTSVSPGGLLIADYDSTTKMATFGVQNITHSFDETTGTLTVGGTGVVPRYFAFTGSDVGNVIFTQSNLVKHLIIDATDMIAIKQDAFMAYTGGCVLEDVEINSTSSTPLIIERNAVFYESGNTVTLTVNAVKLATVTNSPVDNYSTPVNLIYNVEQPITFKKNALTEPRDDLTVTFPAGCKIFIPGGPQFTYSWLQEEYDREAEYGYEEYFWRNHSDLVEGTDYVLGDARYEELTPLNASLVVGDSNTALFSAYTITDESVNGTVTASVNGTDVTEAAADADVLLTVAPDNGYQFKSISATYQKNKVEEFSDLVALMGDAVFSAATYADHPDYTCKVNDGKFVVYDGDTSVAELSEANMTNADLGGTYFSAQCGGLNWSLNFRNGSITDIYVYDSDYNYIFSSADGSKSTGTLPPAVLNLTTVTEGSQYSLTMPKMPVTVTAEFEEAPAPETFKVYVKKPTNETYTTIENLTGETTVAQLKEIIADQIDIPATAQRLIFAGKEILDDAKTLAECKIVDESTIHLVIRGYTVTWLNYDNSELGTTTVQYGSTPTYDGETPTKDADENYTYTFAGWKVGETTYALNEALPPVTGDVTYTATFDATAKVDDTVPESEFLTFTAVENNSSVTLNVYSGSNLLYNKNNSGWQSYTAGTQIALSNAGDSVRFRGKDTTFNDSNFVSIGGKVACSGNVMSLRLDDNGMVQGLSEQCFFCMFMGCTGLTAAPELPETMLAEGCYSYMFYGCTSLTTAPALPATNLAEACYYGMFYDCENLTTAPKLPATTLANECYNSMFEDCERLTTAPELPATTLAQYCYYHMFAGCSSIKLSETKTAEYSIPYSVPSGGNGTTASAALTGMFANTGGTFKGTPVINKTYYVPAPAPTTYTITDASVNGTVTASVNGTNVTEAEENADVTLTVAPAEGYQFVSISAGDVSLTTVTEGSQYSFTMPTKDVTVTAVFEEIPAPELPDVIKDCTYYDSYCGFYANVPFAGMFSDIQNGAIICDSYSETDKSIMDTKDYSYKFYDENGTELQAENIYHDDSADGYGFRVIMNVFRFSNPISGPLYIVATAPAPTYTITWKNYDDSDIGTSTVAEGETPTFSDTIGEIKEKPDNALYTYTFSGWTPDVVAATADATYTATFDAVAKNYFPFANLSLNGDIGVNFWIDTYGYDPEELRVNVSWYKYSNEYYFAGKNALPTREIGDKTYFIATANVAAKEMADTITVRLYKGDTELAAKTYSVRDYALTIINAENPGAIGLALSDDKFAALKDLCKALLKYGSASEAQFDPQYPANIEAHTVDGIVISASDGVSYEDYNEAEIPAYTVPDYSGFAEGLTYYGSSIGTKTTTNYLIAFVGSNAPSVRYNGKTINPVAFGEGGVAYNINGIAAKNIPDDIVLTVNGNDVRFNMLAYITKALNVGDETLQSSVRALYDYGVKAKAYFNMAS